MYRVLLPLALVVLVMVGIALNVQLRNSEDKILELKHIIHSQQGTITKSYEQNKRLLYHVENSLKLAQEWKEKCDG